MTSVLATAKTAKKRHRQPGALVGQNRSSKNMLEEGEGEENVEISTPKMKEAERALFLLFISVEFWQEKRGVRGWMTLEGVLRRRARDAPARARPRAETMNAPCLFLTVLQRKNTDSERGDIIQLAPFATYLAPFLPLGRIRKRDITVFIVSNCT